MSSAKADEKQEIICPMILIISGCQAYPFRQVSCKHPVLPYLSQCPYLIVYRLQRVRNDNFQIFNLSGPGFLFPHDPFFQIDQVIRPFVMLNRPLVILAPPVFINTPFYLILHPVEFRLRLAVFGLQGEKQGIYLLFFDVGII